MSTNCVNCICAKLGRHFLIFPQSRTIPRNKHQTIRLRAFCWCSLSTLTLPVITWNVAAELKGYSTSARLSVHQNAGCVFGALVGDSCDMSLQLLGEFGFPCFICESMRMSNCKRSRKMIKRKDENSFHVNLTKLFKKCRPSKYITIHHKEGKYDAQLSDP